MKLAGVNVDFSNAKVVSVSYPRRGFQMVVEGATVEGRAIRQVKLVFDEVANQEAIMFFLMSESTPEVFAVVCFHEASYPLTLPAKLTTLRQSEQSRPSYNDAAFDEEYGRPAPLRPGQKLYYFALAEKRFKNRKPFPIICRRLRIADGSGKLIAGDSSKPRKSWKSRDYEKIARQFSQAILGGDYQAAYALTSQRLQKLLSLKKLAAEFDEYRQNLPNAKQMDEYYKDIGFEDGYPGRLQIEVTKEDEYWSNQTFPSQLEPESCCTSAIIYFHGLFECTLTLVEEGGSLRIGHYENE